MVSEGNVPSDTTFFRVSACASASAGAKASAASTEASASKTAAAAARTALSADGIDCILCGFSRVIHCAGELVSKGEVGAMTIMRPVHPVKIRGSGEEIRILFARSPDLWIGLSELFGNLIRDSPSWRRTPGIPPRGGS